MTQTSSLRLANMYVSTSFWKLRLTLINANLQRAASVPRNSAPPPNSLSIPPEPPSYSDPSLEMAESGLASIPEIEEPLETDLDPDVPLSKSSGSSFSIGGFLGKLVNVILRSIMNIVSSIFSALGYISWASTQALGIALEGPKNLWKNNSGALVSLVVLALAVYALRQGGTTIPWIAPSRPEIGRAHV